MRAEMPLQKSALLEGILESLKADLSQLLVSARQAHEAATHEEGRAEDPYDTRGLEASYLAGAQARRASELQELIQRYQHLDLRSFGKDDPIAVTAVVELESSGKRGFYFLVPFSGGVTVSLEGRTIQTLSSTSPLGEELLGRKLSKAADLEFEVELSATQTREYRIVSLA